MDLRAIPKNLKIETWKIRPSKWSLRRITAVKVTHIPTGISVTYDADRPKSENEKNAIVDVKKKLIFLKLEPTQPPRTPAKMDDAEQATALQILLAYPGRLATEYQLDTWEKMRELVVSEYRENCNA